MSDGAENQTADGNRVDIPGVGECFRLETEFGVGGLIPKKGPDGRKAGKKRVVFLASTPALAIPAGVMLRRAEVDKLIAALTAVRGALWDYDKHPPTIDATIKEAGGRCDCPKCRARRAAGEAGR